MHFSLWEWVSFCFLNSCINILGTTTLYEIRSICCVGAFSRVIDVFGGGEKGGKRMLRHFWTRKKRTLLCCPFFRGVGGATFWVGNFRRLSRSSSSSLGSGEKLFPLSVVVAPPPILSVRRKRRDSTEILSAVSKFRTYLAFMWESPSSLKLFSYFCQGLVKYSTFWANPDGREGGESPIISAAAEEEEERRKRKKSCWRLSFPLSLSVCLSTFVTN